MAKKNLPFELQSFLMTTAAIAPNAIGAEERFVGEITDGPSAPTSLVLLQDGLTALEPFSQTITRYSARVWPIS